MVLNDLTTVRTGDLCFCGADGYDVFESCDSVGSRDRGCTGLPLSVALPAKQLCRAPGAQAIPPTLARSDWQQPSFSSLCSKTLCRWPWSHSGHFEIAIENVNRKK